MKKTVNYGQRDRSLTVFEIGVHRLLNKILKGLRKKKEIHSFFSIPQISKNKLNSFRVFFSKDKFFEICFQEANTFNPLNGAEVGECRGWKMTILLGKNYTARGIHSLILEEVKNRKVGLGVEESCRKAIQILIDNDTEMRSVVSSLRIPTTIQDRDLKIDLFLKTKKGNVPLQIKSSISGQVSHKNNSHQVPSIVFKENMKTDELKDKIILICRSYPKIIEHL